MKCLSLGCSRKPRVSSSGAVMAHCDACTRRYLRDAFSENPPLRWFDRAKAHQLPPSIVGGTAA